MVAEQFLSGGKGLGTVGADLADKIDDAHDPERLWSCADLLVPMLEGCPAGV